MKKKLLKNKKGQFYILTAVILCVTAYTAFERSNLTTGNDETIFRDYVQNFKTEAPIVINSAILNEYDVDLELSYLINDYNRYLENINRKLSIIYLLKINNQISIVSSYDDPLSIITPGYSYIIAKNNKLNISIVDYIQINIDNEQFRYEFNQLEPVEFKVLFIE